MVSDKDLTLKIYTNDDKWMHDWIKNEKFKFYCAIKVFSLLFLSKHTGLLQKIVFNDIIMQPQNQVLVSFCLREVHRIDLRQVLVRNTDDFLQIESLF